MTYWMDGQEIDSVELKALLISRGVRVSEEIYRRYGTTARLSKNPLTCNSILLPDNTIIQMTDLSFHMDYIKSVMNWNTLSLLRYMPQMKTDFQLKVNPTGNPAIYYKNREVTPIHLNRHSDFYLQKTTSGLPFLGNAVLQGKDWLSFQLLWKCDYALQGLPCQYCFSGGELASLKKKKQPFPQYPSPRDVAEIVEYAVLKEKCANSIQITGGSSFNERAEVDQIIEILDEIERRVGRENIQGEIVVYTTPPKNPEVIDILFSKGVDRVSCSLEIWDQDLAAKIMPGKMKYLTRERQLNCLFYIAKKFGKNKACSNFIVGLEPVNSLLEGAEFLASRGVVPIASVWIPFGRPVQNSMKAPDLEYYREVKRGLASIYQRFALIPPGAQGLNVCFCRDIYMHLCRDSRQQFEEEMK